MGITKNDATRCDVEDQQDDPRPILKPMAAVLHVPLAVALADELVEQGSIPAQQQPVDTPARQTQRLPHTKLLATRYPVIRLAISSVPECR